VPLCPSRGVRPAAELRGTALACWCRHDGEAPTPETACHEDVLVSLLDTYTDEEIRAMTDEVHT
jgi:hypothetical protein